MDDEVPFRIALSSVFALTMCIVGYHRLRAHTGEPIDRREEGVLLAVTLRLAGLVLWVAVIAYLINPRWMAWSQLPLPHAVRASGAIVGLLASLLMYWTLTNLGENLTDSVVTRSAARLVTAGPYRWVRHPFYVTFALLIAAAVLLSANWFIAVSGVLVFVLLDVRTPKEEQNLIDRFGDGYRDYMRATGKYLPKVGRQK